MNIHFIGNEGVSMRALMQIVKADGHNVSGSDATTTGHSASYVKNAELVVYSSAIKKNNVELAYAKKHGIKTISRAQFLYELSRQYSTVIAVCGCHGKTTTSTMLASIFSPDNPTLHIGATIDYPTVGKKNVFISEACEYKRNFLTLYPDVGVVTNVDFDHPDCYKNLADTQDAFLQFCSHCKTVLINADDENSKNLLKCENVVSYGTNPSSDFVAKNYVKTNTGCSFSIFYKDLFLTNITLNLFGTHNFYNALSACCCAFCLGVGSRQISEGILNYKSAKRRCEFLGKVKNCDVFTDYAHHPKEIVCTIKALKEKYSNLAIVFQPHTFSRTKALLNEFTSAFTLANKVYFVPTYASREKGVDNGFLSKLVANSTFIPSDAKRIVYQSINDFDALCFMGAGDVDAIAREFCDENK